MNLDFWHVGNSQRLVTVEVGLIDNPICQCDLIAQRGSEAIADATFDLCANHVWVDGDAAVHRRYNAIDSDLAARYNCHIRDHADDSIKALMQGNPATPSARHQCTEFSRRGHQLEDSYMTRMSLKQRDPKSDWIFLRSMGHFVDHNLHCLGGM